eukprot:801337-Prorocentrum_minimum.AAC.7
MGVAKLNNTSWHATGDTRGSPVVVECAGCMSAAPISEQDVYRVRALKSKSAPLDRCSMRFIFLVHGGMVCMHGQYRWWRGVVLTGYGGDCRHAPYDEWPVEHLCHTEVLPKKEASVGTSGAKQVGIHGLHTVDQDLRTRFRIG